MLPEKFDDDRLRFSRPDSACRKDEMLPYEVDHSCTTGGMSEDALAFQLVSVLLPPGRIAGRWSGNQVASVSRETLGQTQYNKRRMFHVKHALSRGVE